MNHKDLKDISNLHIAKEVLDRRKAVMEECVNTINEQLLILDVFGIKIYDEDNTMILHSIKKYDTACEMEIEYL